MTAATSVHTRATTTWARVTGALALLVACLVVLAYALWRADGGDTLVTGLVPVVYGSRRVFPGANLLFAVTFGHPLDDSAQAAALGTAYSAELIRMLMLLAPIAVAGACWYALPRLRRHNPVGLWLSASFTMLWLLLLLVGLCGAAVSLTANLAGSPDAFRSSPVWSAALIAVFPGVLVLVAGLAMGSASAGLLLATLIGYALAPRTAAPDAGSTNPSVVSLSLAAALLQWLLFAALDASLLRESALQWQWTPLAAALIATGTILGRALPGPTPGTTSL